MSLLLRDTCPAVTTRRTSVQNMMRPGVRALQEIEYQEFVCKAIQRLNATGDKDEISGDRTRFKQSECGSDTNLHHSAKRRRMKNYQMIDSSDEELELDQLISKREVIHQNSLLAAENASLRKRLKDNHLLFSSLHGLRTELQGIKRDLIDLKRRATINEGAGVELHHDTVSTEGECHLLETSQSDSLSSCKEKALHLQSFIAGKTACKSISMRQTLTNKPEPDLDSNLVACFGDKYLTGKQLQKCKHSGKLSRLTLDLFGMLFTPYEMALGNLTGKTTANGCNNVRKKRLQEGRISGIVDYVHHFMKGEVHNRLTIEEEVRRVIANKVNNFSKSVEAKLMRAKEEERLEKSCQFEALE